MNYQLLKTNPFIIRIITVNQIEKVFNAASHKKVWDHFSRAQRKNIESWRKQATVCKRWYIFQQTYVLGMND